MNALGVVILAIQGFSVAAWLSSLAAGRRLLGEYKAICAGAAIAAALSLALAAAPLGRAPGPAPVAAGAPASAVRGDGVAGGAAPVISPAAPFGPAAPIAAALACRAAVGLCAVGALLFGLRLARYARWARSARRRSVLVGREGGVEYRSWDGPACSFGALRPVALLPESRDRDRARAMRLHEAAHLGLGHVYWNFVQAMAADLFWFNPLFRLFELRGREAREFEADEAAARGMGTEAYAASLVAEAEAGLPSVGTALASLWGAGLAERIGALAEGRKKPSALALAALLAAAALCAGASSPLSAASPAAPASPTAPAAPAAPRFLGGRCRVIDAAGAVKVTQGFGEATDPFDGSRFFHEGIDLAVPGNTRPGVVAWDSGRVSRAGFDETYGNYVEVAHDGGYVTFYSKLAVRAVAAGDAVARGQRIGVLGSTGRSTGPHLHFVISKDGEKLDPSPYL